ncbi:MAG TPA: TetR family transcriptional regulator [Candidatus Dormibacteraeota bacterium]|nr:TetR family transcriptional regulator [Candidatus Dormibacteraeota bacterium]
MSVGLRERKKLKTRNAIQKEAMRLFLAKGFDETTIEDIAEAVEISPSTFFNYFPSKEAVVFQDDLDPLIIAAFNAQPPQMNPIGALRLAMHEVFGRLPPEVNALTRERMALVISTPALRAATVNEFADLVDQIAQLIAHRAGRSPKDFAVRNLSGALLGVMISSYFSAAEDPDADLFAVIDKSMRHLEAGLPLDWANKKRR